MKNFFKKNCLDLTKFFHFFSFSFPAKNFKKQKIKQEIAFRCKDKKISNIV